MQKSNIEPSGAINYYILGLMFAGILVFGVANAYEPDIYGQLDFFETALIMAQYSVGIFGLFVAIRYRGSKVFGRAYLALGIGFLLLGTGNIVFTAAQMAGLEDYPGYADIFIAPFFMLLLFHLVTCTRYFKKKLEPRDKFIIIALPVVVNIVYVFALLVPITIPGSVPDAVSSLEVNIDGRAFKLVPIDSLSNSDIVATYFSYAGNLYALVPLDTTANPQIPLADLVPATISNFTIVGEPMPGDPHFWSGFLIGLYYNSATTINLAWAIIGMTVFRNSLLGKAWGLLLVGIAVLAVADIIYDFSSIYYYDRTSPTIAIWVFGFMIMCYALYLHRKNV
jgi:hypothetical protein